MLLSSDSGDDCEFKLIEHVRKRKDLSDDEKTIIKELTQKRVKVVLDRLPKPSTSGVGGDIDT